MVLPLADSGLSLDLHTGARRADAPADFRPSWLGTGRGLLPLAGTSGAWWTLSPEVSPQDGALVVHHGNSLSNIL